MTEGKTLSVRVSKGQAADLEAFASFDGVAIAEEVRQAIEMLLEARRNDPDFRERVRGALERGRRLLEEMGEREVAQPFSELEANLAPESRQAQPVVVARSSARKHR